MTNPTGNAEQLRAQARSENLALGSLATPGLALITLIVLIPIAWLFWLSVRDAQGFTLAHYVRLFHPSYLLTLQTTFELSFLVTGICVLLGYPLAYVIAQAKGRMAAILLMLVMFPIWTSLL
ncbi:MAG: ABC transporter permease, partial [Hyphomicrobiaceae bacterium]